MTARRLLGELLLERGYISSSQLLRGLEEQQGGRGKLGACLVRVGFLTEPQLVEGLSLQLQVTVAPEARLRQVRPSAAVLQMVDPAFARRHRVLPIFFNEGESSLTLVVEDPLDLDVLGAIKRVNQVKRLRVLLAGPSLLDEVIRDTYGQATVPDGDPPEERFTPTSISQNIQGILFEPDDRRAESLAQWLFADGTVVMRAGSCADVAVMGAALPGVPIFTCSRSAGQLRAEMGGNLPIDRIQIIPHLSELEGLSNHRRSGAQFTTRLLEALLATLDAQHGGPYLAWSRRTIQLCRALAPKFKVTEEQFESVVQSAYLLGISRCSTGQDSQAVENGLEEGGNARGSSLVSRLNPPFEMGGALAGQLEWRDRESGVSRGVAILDAASRFVEVRDGLPGSPGQGTERALEAIRALRMSRFDTEVVDHLHYLVMGDPKVERIGEGPRPEAVVLLIGLDRALQIHVSRFLSEHGLECRLAEGPEDGFRQFDAISPRRVVCTAAAAGSNLELFTQMKRVALHPLQFLLVGCGWEGDLIGRALEGGVDDYLPFPLSVDLLLAKLLHPRNSSSHEPRQAEGIRGALADMSVLDLLQMMHLGVRTARIRLENRGRVCDLFVDKGNLVYAVIRGENSGPEAFFSLCRWTEGSFVVTPGGAAPERNIFSNNDFLMMEGMRRADEHLAGIQPGSVD